MGAGTGSSLAITPTISAIEPHEMAGNTDMVSRLVEKGKRAGAGTRLVVFCAISAAFNTASAHAQDLSGLPTQLLEKVEAAQQACSDFENGQFALELGAIHRVDLDGDIQRDWVLDEAGFACSTAVSLYCGTGGCVSHFLIEDRMFSLLNQGWDMANIGPFRVLLADVHGSQCGGINPTPCVVASVWDSDEMVWRSTGAEWE